MCPIISSGSGDSAKTLLKGQDGLTQAGVRLHFLAYRAMGMKNRGVVSPETISNGWQGLLGHFAAQIHGHLARERDVLRPLLAGHVAEPDVVVFGNRPLDPLDGQGGLFLLLDRVAQQIFQCFVRQRFSGQGGIRSGPQERTLQLPDV